MSASATQGGHNDSVICSINQPLGH